MSDHLQDEFFTASQAAEYLNLSTSTFYSRVKAGDIKPVPNMLKTGRKFRKSDLDAYREAWLKAQAHSAAPSASSVSSQER